MAEDFQTGGTCSGSWWSTAATLSSCSAPLTDIGSGDAGGGRGGFSWVTAVAAEHPESKALSGEDPGGSCSGSSITLASPSAAAVAGSQFVDISGFGLASPGAVDWNQAFFRSSGSMIQEHNQEQTGGAVSGGGGDYVNHNLLLDQHHMSSGEPVGFPITPSPSYSGSLTSTFFQSLFESDNTPASYQSPPPPAWLKFPHLIKNSSSPPKQPQLPAAVNNLHFTNNTPFWNAASAGAATDPWPGFYSPTASQFVSQPPLDHKPPFFSALTSKANTDQVGRERKGSNDPSFKKPRVETPSPLPTFKVRKEKLGDRITALQQLVAPFGKTDTASVLHEAIEYIKFLHEQVGVLSTPYFKNGHPMQNQQGAEKSKDEGPMQDLRSRGLCLVSISSTFPVASETPADFWTPTFGGTYR